MIRGKDQRPISLCAPAEAMPDHLGITVSGFGHSVAFYKKALAPRSVIAIKERAATDTGANAHVGFGCGSKAFF